MSVIAGSAMCSRGHHANKRVFVAGSVQHARAIAPTAR